MKKANLQDLSKKIPIFPLTGAVLFPGTQLPLNIFEPRYVQMIDDALASPGRLLGMIQPEKPNQDKNNKIEISYYRWTRLYWFSSNKKNY